MLKHLELTALAFGLFATVALGSTVYPYTIAEYEADNAQEHSSMYSEAVSWAEPGQIWDMSRIIEYGSHYDDNSGVYDHVVYSLTAQNNWFVPVLGVWI